MITPEEREAELIGAGMDVYRAREVVDIETGAADGCCLPPRGGPLGESAVTRALTDAEQANLVQARVARGEEPYPTTTPEHRARLEADRAAAIADDQSGHFSVQHPTVRQLLRQLEAGTLSIGEIAEEFSRRDWTIPVWSDRYAYWGDEPVRANDWRDVESARRGGHITPEQYQALKDARGSMRTRDVT